MIGVTALGEYIMSYAVELVPVNTGRLRQSGYVAPPATTNDPLTVQIGFCTNYAGACTRKRRCHTNTARRSFSRKLCSAGARCNKVATWAERRCCAAAIRALSSPPAEAPPDADAAL